MVKLYLSDDVVHFFLENDCNEKESSDCYDEEIQRVSKKAREQFSHRHADGKYHITDDVFDFFIGCADWYINAWMHQHIMYES